MKINNILPDDNSYTQILSNIAQKPKRLYYRGDLPVERTPTIAIVGTRKPSRYGSEVTHSFAYELARRGILIVSGLALGVDGLAHRAALEAGGKTIAVLANGLATIYPRPHEQLAQSIIEKGGAIISEYEPNTPPMQFRFLERNRLVSGLADGILITEAAARSGTLSTATHALEQGREVFVIPGNITSPLSAGCNRLIRQGATPVLTPDDIIEIIAPKLEQSQIKLALGENPLQTLIIELLQQGLRDGDELQHLAKVSQGEFATELTLMEIAGTIRSLGGNQWTLR